MRTVQPASWKPTDRLARLTIKAGYLQDEDMAKFRAFAVLLTVFIGSNLTWVTPAAEPARPTSSDRCKVCGMFVEKYRNWIAIVSFEDGAQLFFDGPKDMFKYILNPKKYNGRTSGISGVFVTDYYSTRFIDAREAFFVAGSDVMGPMGHELVSIGNADDARTFLEDHAGTAILSFGEVTPEKIPR